MVNIFKNAYFGKLYRTEDGRKAAFVNWNDRMTKAFLYVKERDMEFYGEEMYDLDGTTSKGSTSHDIVSEWVEPIDEEKLDELAKNIVMDILRKNVFYSYQYNKKSFSAPSLTELVKAGYHKGWEDKK